MTPLPLFSSPMLFVIGAFVCALAIFFGTLYAANPQKISERKAIFWVTGIVSGIFLLYVAFYATVSAIGGRQIDSALAELKRDGAKLTLEEIIPPKIPDSENADLFYRKAFAVMEKSENVKKMLKRYEDFCRDSYSVEDWRMTREALAGGDAREILASLRQGASCPKLRFNRDYEKPLWDTLLSSLSPLDSSQLLIIAAMTANRNGKQELAYDYLETGFAICQQVNDDPFFISKVVQIHMFMDQVDCLTRLVRKSGVSTSRAEMFIRRARALDIGAEIIRSFNAEIVFTRIVFTAVIDGEYATPFGGCSLDARFSWLAFGLWPFNRMDFACCLRKIIAVKSALEKPYWETKIVVKGKSEPPDFCLLAKFSFPTYEDIVIEVAQANTAVENAVQSLALEIYKNKYGSYPERLEQLVPEVLPTLPPDPYTGKPFRYQKKGATYELTSEWLDEKRAREMRSKR